MDVTHCPELSLFSFLHVCINTNSSFNWATPLQNEVTQHVITHLLGCFAVMAIPSSIKKTMALSIFLDTLNNFKNPFLLNILQVFLIIHRHKV